MNLPIWFILFTLKATKREGIFQKYELSTKNGLQKTVTHFVEDIAPLLWNLLKFNEIKNNYIVDYLVIK